MSREGFGGIPGSGIPSHRYALRYPDKPVAVGWTGTQGGGMGFFDDAPAPVPEPLWRHHHPWDPPEAEFPSIVPIGTTLLGRSDRAAVAITGLAAFSNGFEIQLTARSRPRDGDDVGPKGWARHSFRFGLQLSDGTKVFGRQGRPPRGHDAEPEGPVLHAFAGGGTPLSFLSRWWAWPLPPKGTVEFVAEWPDLGLPESRAGLDAGMILDGADRAIRLWPEPGA